MQNTNIVAEYDYYTLDQARKILRKESYRRKQKRRKEQIESIKFYTVLFLGTWGIAFLMFFNWLIFGY